VYESVAYEFIARFTCEGANEERGLLAGETDCGCLPGFEAS
jgi:hypothetical protein